MKKHHASKLRALSAHFEQEIECLERLLNLLCDEGVALRALDTASLETLLPAKEKLVARQRLLVIKRLELISAFAASPADVRLSQLFADMNLTADNPIVEKSFQLRLLAEQVSEANKRNFNFAQSGSGLVTNLIRVIVDHRSPQARTYARNGHLRRNVLDAIPHGGQLCSV